jgi:NAD(P)-dependent dehydrogenase (short-subunit alcohol dehydrogenase family)
MTNRLAEKVCIITGTGGGMGREAALIFAREGFGCWLWSLRR